MKNRAYAPFHFARSVVILLLFREYWRAVDINCCNLITREIYVSFMAFRDELMCANVERCTLIVSGKSYIRMQWARCLSKRDDTTVFRTGLICDDYNELKLIRSLCVKFTLMGHKGVVEYCESSYWYSCFVCCCSSLSYYLISGIYQKKAEPIALIDNVNQQL